ncbi:MULTISPECIES: hypothetical protein [unclassified Cytobacillus]|uniref:hypothetical protein n=1 Tax=unclassified Cytobacillus TaxID=2675268 RepID=UPI00135A76C6|nr:hypothetical protein [Cytobacillus sp. AMY 15.2]KAF0817025.1 hypothetical protein KIS4809_4125 [Bacillus sp. ZZV12-4809]MCM3090033.1 hypothetical protein [Cytobacillus sp. AMY 15.2]
MCKWMLAFTACMMLTACSGGEEKKDEAAKKENSSQEYNEATNTEGEKKPLSIAELDERIDEGMNIDTYSAEVQSWSEKGQLEMKETVVVEDENTSSADILQLADGFLGVAYDEKEVTKVKMFQSAEHAKEYFESL